MATASKEAITFIVSGQMQPLGATRSASRAGGVTEGSSAPRVKASVRVGATRAGGDKLRLSAIPDEDVVVLHLAGGPSLTLHPETARDLLLGMGPRKRTRGATQAPDEVEVNADLGWQGMASASPQRTRGLVGKLVLAGIEVLCFGKYDGAVADLAATGVVAKVDGQVAAGVYTLPKSGSLSALKAQTERLCKTVPAALDGGAILVLIHGTFVDTVSTFGKLWDEHPRSVERLFAAYGQRVYALDHPTLGASPFANALTLVQAMPDGARLHLLTHSRGGLVAEVLARLAGQRRIDAADLVPFKGDAYKAQRQEMDELLQAIVKKNIQVERVVRVACPARGTLLASRRLDAYLSVLTWGLKASGALVAAEVLDFLNAVAERRADPALIPGLEAMMPGSALVQWLNRPNSRIPGDLRVVAGDLQGDSIGSWLKTLLSDAFYWTDNDIVVHTRSMYGGSPRVGGASFVLDQSGKASHFAYFRNALTVDAVVEGLTQNSPAGFQPIGPLSWAGDTSDGVRSARSGATPPAPPNGQRPGVIVVPGLLGSNLEVGGKRIWLGLRLLGGFDQLRYQPDGADNVQPDGPIHLIYGALIEHLKMSHDVAVFDFDWRRPIEEEARRLAIEVEKQLDARASSGQPVRLIVHSMGGVVARTLQLEKPNVWQRLMAHPGARLVMLGTPNGGSWAPMQALTGDDTFSNTLTAVGSPFQDQEARQIMAQMPGFMQLQAGLTDTTLALDKEDTWRKLARDDLQLMRERSWWHRNWLQSEGRDETAAVYEWGIPPQTVLDQVAALRKRLDGQHRTLLADFKAGKVLMVVGRAKFTPDGYELAPDEGFVYRNAVDGGDGRVPLQMALLPEVRTWTLDADHGSLPSAKQAFAAFDELLLQGNTERLPRLAAAAGATRSAGSAASGVASAVADSAAKVQHVLSRPSRARRLAAPAATEGGLLDATFETPASADTGADAATQNRLSVSVLNGNLAFIRRPLLVGHYKSMALTGTENVVDRLIGRTMSTALSLNSNFYPEAPGSHQVFVNTLRDPSVPVGLGQPPAVVVVGLGEEGKLREPMLAASVRQAVLGWLQRRAEEQAQDGSEGPVKMAATLLGSGGFGITAGAAARAIAQGVADANQRVSEANSRGGHLPWPLVGSLQLVELYLDRASEAWRELKSLQAGAKDRFHIDDSVKSGTGGLRRPLDAGYRGADYDFIRVVSSASGMVEFALDSRRARNDLREQSTQVALVEELVKTAATDTNSDTQLGRTLFQLLVPPSIEPYLGGTTRLLLELDLRSAAIPWELLDTPVDGKAVDQRPWSLRSRMLRKMQLKDNQMAARADAIADDAVLVIGEPHIDRPEYGPLDAALREAQAVSALLQRGLGAGRVQSLYKERARPIINALLERPWRILHVSGHGEASAKGGVVLSGKAFLGPDEIGAMRTVPELVFVNCCHLAAVSSVAAKTRDFQAAGFAAGVAERLIGIGVRCVVAAGWAVEDEAANAFAVHFYERLLAGDNFANAVGAARDLAWQMGGNTWAAYQCYGDPDWRLSARTADAQGPVVPLHDVYAGIASPLGLATALETLAVGSEWQHLPAEGQLSRIGYLEGQHGQVWGGMGAVAEAFGVAYAAAGAFDPAIDWFRKALQSKDSSASIKVNEHLGNLLARQGFERLRGKKGKLTEADFTAARETAREGWTLLKLLVGLQATSERWSLVGSACKRLARVEHLAGNTLQEASWLQAMDEAYAFAERRAQEENNNEWFYPALNRLAGQLRHHRLDPKNVSAPSAQQIAAVRASLQAKSLTDPDFWTEAGQIELDSYETLIHEPDPAQLDAERSRYEDLHRRAPAPKNWRTVADQWDFVIGPSIQGRKSGALVELLKVVKGLST